MAFRAGGERKEEKVERAKGEEGNKQGVERPRRNKIQIRRMRLIK
jgi:hypothetical protein